MAEDNPLTPAGWRRARVPHPMLRDVTKEQALKDDIPLYTREQLTAGHGALGVIETLRPWLKHWPYSGCGVKRADGSKTCGCGLDDRLRELMR